MENTKTTAFSNSLIWFGAGVSIAEILTGTCIAPLGFKKGVLAVILGHIIGCALLFLAGLIGAKTEKGSMDTVKLSFGKKGTVFFSILNIIQLTGWTAVMVLSGASSAETVFGGGREWIWCIVICLLILLWIVIDPKNLDKVNIVAISLLFVLTLVLSRVVFKNGGTYSLQGDISFGAAVELSVAMPLSWLPLVSDYTRYAKKPVSTSIAGSVSYFFASMWMYLIGMGASVYSGESDISLVMLKAGLGVFALIIIIFSTVTTTFLDVYSAGVSFESISPKLKQKPLAVLVCILGTVLAVFTPITQYEAFLYFIGSVFAPMTAILITDAFILKRDCSDKNFDKSNFIIWVIGFVIYRLFMKIDTYAGCTFPAMIITVIMCIAVNKAKKGKR